MDNNEMSNSEQLEEETGMVSVEPGSEEVSSDDPSFAEKSLILITHLKDCLESIVGLGRKSTEHANALANLKQCIHNLQNDARL